MRRTGSIAFFALALTASFATVSRAQETSASGSISAPAPQPPPQVTGTPVAPPTSPLALHVGDADLTIGGFMDATAVIRSTNTGNGLGTNFGALPFSNTAAGQLSETRLSAQNSRVTLLATSKAGDTAIKGYLESDFLGAGPANQFVTSNSATLRMRLYWVQATTGAFEFLAGQSWSLLVPGRSGISPNPGDLFYSQDVDTNYQLGLTWTRTMGFRFVVHPAKTIAAAVAFENPEQYVGGAVVLPARFAAGEVDSGGGNTATPNPYPDIIGKLAIDPVTGRTHQHFEVAGLVRGFKTTDGGSPNATFTATASGVSAAANIEPVRSLHLVGTGFVAKGGGRYIANAGLPDLIVNADSSLSLVRSNSWIVGVEAQATPETLVYGYYSEARGRATTAFDANGTTPIGFGIAGQSAANQRIVEGTIGLTHIFFRDPKIGGMQLMLQYSHVKRAPFSVAAGGPNDATSNMVFVNVRYILP